MANNFTNVNLNTFFDKLDGGATWSAGVAFKRAAALPLERYEVHKSYDDAVDYAKNNAVAYPGQVIAVVETEGTEEKIKIYFIDETKNLQEVGSATLGDNATIVLDPETKQLSIKGFENAGFALTNDTTIGDKDYFTYDTEDDQYIKVESPAANPKGAGYFERIAVKLIKDSAGNLAWITDDAVQIQGNIASLQTTVGEHTQKISSLETAVEDANARIDGLGTVLNFVGVLTVEEFAGTTNEAGVITSDEYKVGNVILVGNQEYVVTEVGGDLKWEAFGDPSGIATLQEAVEKLTTATTGNTDAIDVLNGDVGVAGSVKAIAKGYADTAESNAKAHANSLDEATKVTTADHETRIGNLKDQVELNKTSIANINSAIGSETTEDSIKKDIADLKADKAEKTVVDELTTKVGVIEGNALTKSEAAGLYETKENVEVVRTAVNDLTPKVAANEQAIKSLQGADTGLDERITATEGTIGIHSSRITILEGQMSELTNETNGTIKTINDKIAATNTKVSEVETQANKGVTDAAAAQQTADEAKANAKTAQETAEDGVSKAEAAQGTANQAVADAKEADDKAAAAGTAAGNAQDTADEAKAKAEANEAKFANYYTKTEIDGKVDTIIGTDADTASTNSIAGTKKYTDDKVAVVSSSVNELSAKLDNVTNVMDFIGISETDPATGTVTIKSDIITPNIGDVVIYDGSEYVYTGSDGWELFGNVTAAEDRLDTVEKNIIDLQSIVGTDSTKGLQKKVADLEAKAETQGTSITDVSGRVTTLEGEMDAAEGRLTATEAVANAAAKNTDLQAEVNRATARENEIAEDLSDALAAQSTKNSELTSSIENITNVETGLLAWGTF